ncbi:auxin response factor 16 [Actinidia rufa]|uniref:Auxin response factor n=1 Tax=Actinidia rufa TaxID=165716 RepID=A0A7J0DCR9_9ERIC|nr:auxin response factor 16 [Actinidia rufa]
MNEIEKCLDSQLWYACAGGMVQIPPINTKIFYFPQGHAEHAHEKVDFGNFPRIPPLLLCRVSGIKFLADSESGEVYAKIRLVPLRNDCDFDCDDDGFLGMEKTDQSQEKPASFAKTLTLDYSAEPPVQTILAKDVHGEIWKFRHIYRGTPHRHLLTTGWSNFVNQKKLVAGDSIVFLIADNGDLCVGIRRAKRGMGGGPESPSGWNALCGNCASPFVGYSAFLSQDENKSMQNGGRGSANSNGASMGKVKARAVSVIEAATIAANGQPFVVVYYPRASAPEFCVKASVVRAAMRIQWCPGMRFKMAFETEDSSHISWFMGTISSVQVDDPIRWPNSPWRLLQVAWDEPNLLQDVKRVSPWLVELVSNMPAIHLSPFSPPRKKLRVPQPPNFPFIGQFPMSSFPSNPPRPVSPLHCVSDNIPAGIQGARHAHYGLSLPDLHFNKLHSGPFSFGLAHPPRVPFSNVADNPENTESLSCLLTMGLPTQSLKKNYEIKAPMFFLFGQPILVEQQISESYFGDTFPNSSSDNGPPDNSSDDGSPWYKHHQKSKFGLETGHCKVFVESDDVGRTLDLKALGSYEELYRKLATMFSMAGPEPLSNVLYQNTARAIKHAGDEPFSEFSKTAKRLTILLDSGSDNLGR